MKLLSIICLVLGGHYLVSAQFMGDQWVMGYGQATGHPEFAMFSMDFRTAPPIYHIFPDIHHFILGTSANVYDSGANVILHTNGMELLSTNDNNSFDTIAYGGYWDFYDVGTFAIGFLLQEGATILPFPGSNEEYAVIYHNSSWHPIGIFIPDRIMWAQVIMQSDKSPEVSFKDSVVSPADTWYSLGMVPVRHANGRDWWVTVFEYDSSRYFSFILDPSGLSLQIEGRIDTAVVTGLGQTAFSWKGNYFARLDAELIDEPETITLCRFDRCSGELTRIMTTEIEFGNWSGVAFSPDERYLYAGNRTSLYQWDLQASDIEGSRICIDTSSVQNRAFGPMRTGPDGRIYSIPGAGNSLYGHTIDRPYLVGSEQPTLRKIHFPRNNGRALPNNPNYRLGPVDGSPCDTLNIDNLPVARWRWMVPDSSDLQNIAFTDLSYYEPEAWFWEFDDGMTSTEKHPEHRYGQAGLYHVCLTVSNNFATDSTCQWIEVDMTSAIDDPAGSPGSLHVSPNPFTETIKISLREDLHVQWQRLHITDMHGRTVMNQEVPVPSVIHLEHLPAGIYAFVLYSQNNVLIGSEMVMKMDGH